MASWREEISIFQNLSEYALIKQDLQHHFFIDLEINYLDTYRSCCKEWWAFSFLISCNSRLLPFFQIHS